MVLTSLGAGVATVALTGIAAAPYLLASLVRKRMPDGGGAHAVGSCVQRDPSGLIVRLFYPLPAGAAEEPGGGGGPWLPAPQSLYLTAIGAFLNLPASIAGWLLAPGLKAVGGAWREQPQPGALPADAGQQLPIVCLSHGLGAFQNVYSVLCCELASRGMVVVVPEHADGSACGTSFPDDDTTIFCERSSEARMTNPETGEQDGGFSWRNGQIHQRVEQVFGALGWLLESASSPEHPWHGRLDAGNVVMAGHSFGGATAVAACAAAPPQSGGPASIAAGLGFSGFRCGVVLDGWLFPIVGDGEKLDTRQIDTSFGHPSYGSAADADTDAAAASTATPLLFLDAASFLADQRWWVAKQELVERSSSSSGGGGGHGASALLNLNHSVHHTFSDVLIVGEKAMALIKKLQRDSRRGIKRGGVANEDHAAAAAAPAAAVAAAIPSAEDLHAETVDIMLRFVATHVPLGDGDDGDGSAKAKLITSSSSEDSMWKILAAGETLGLEVNHSADAVTAKM